MLLSELFGGTTTQAGIPTPNDYRKNSLNLIDIAQQTKTINTIATFTLPKDSYINNGYMAHWYIPIAYKEFDDKIVIITYPAFPSEDIGFNFLRINKSDWSIDKSVHSDYDMPWIIQSSNVYIEDESTAHFIFKKENDDDCKYIKLVDGAIDGDTDHADFTPTTIGSLLWNDAGKFLYLASNGSLFEVTNSDNNVTFTNMDSWEFVFKQKFDITFYNNRGDNYNWRNKGYYSTITYTKGTNWYDPINNIKFYSLAQGVIVDKDGEYSFIDFSRLPVSNFRTLDGYGLAIGSGDFGGDGHNIYMRGLWSKDEIYGININNTNYLFSHYALQGLRHNNNRDDFERIIWSNIVFTDKGLELIPINSYYATMFYKPIVLNNQLYYLRYKDASTIELLQTNIKG